MPRDTNYQPNGSPDHHERELITPRQSRRRFLLAAAGTATAGLAGCLGGDSQPSDQAEEQPAEEPAASTPTALEGTEFIPGDVLQRARDEGEVVFISAMDEPDLLEFFKPRFEEKFPAITAKVQGLGSSEIATKLVSENRSGNIQSDVTLVSRGPMRAVSDRDVFEELSEDHWLYQQCEEMGYAPGLWDPNAGSPAYELPALGNPYTLLYNKETVTEAEAPDSYEGLSSDQWTGDRGISMQHPATLSSTAGLYATLWELWGEEKWTREVTRLMNNNPQLTSTSSKAYRTLVQGEKTLTISKVNDLAGQLAAGEEPVLAAKWPEPTLTTPATNQLTKNGPNPNAGMVLVSWLLSEEGQQTIGDTGRGPLHPATASSHELFSKVIPEGVTIQPEGFNDPTYQGANFVDDPNGWVPLFEEHFGNTPS